MKGTANDFNKFIVACEFQSGSRMVFERVLDASGVALQLSDRLWLLHAMGTAGSIRNHLQQHLGTRDKLIVIQIQAERAATQNCGPEFEARLRAILYLETANPKVA